MSGQLRGDRKPPHVELKEEQSKLREEQVREGRTLFWWSDEEAVTARGQRKKTRLEGEDQREK